MHKPQKTSNNVEYKFIFPRIHALIDDILKRITGQALHVHVCILVHNETLEVISSTTNHKSFILQYCTRTIARVPYIHMQAVKPFFTANFRAARIIRLKSTLRLNTWVVNSEHRV